MATVNSTTGGDPVKPKKNKVATSTGPAFTADERKRFGVSATGGIDQRTANAIMRERRGIAKGGTSNEDITKAEEDAYNSIMNEASAGSKGGGGGNPYGNMLQALQQLSKMSQGTINSSMDTLTQSLQQQANPFANFQAQQTQTTPELAQLLQSQGVSQDPLQQYAAAINAQNQGQATAYQNLANTMGTLNTQNQQGMVGDVGQQRADLMNQLQGNILGVGSKLIGSKGIDRNAIIQLLLAGMKNRA
jgi:hypothetical protein